MERRTSTLRSRRSRSPRLIGGSMAIRHSSCRRWFCSMSLSAPTPLVAGSALERQRFVPDDVHAGDMGTIPDRFEDAIGEPRPKEVLDGRHREEVVDTENRLLGIQAGQKMVEFD